MKTDWLFDLNRDGSSEGWEDATIKNFRETSEQPCS